MIPLVFIFILGMVLNVLSMLLALANWAIPEAFKNSVYYWLSYLGYGSGFINLDAMFYTLGVIASFFYAFFIFKAVIAIINLIPGVNIDTNFLHSHARHDIPQGRVVNLRGSRVGHGYRANYSGKKFYDIKPPR